MLNSTYLINKFHLSFSKTFMIIEIIYFSWLFISDNLWLRNHFCIIEMATANLYEYLKIAFSEKIYTS